MSITRNAAERRNVYRVQPASNEHLEVVLLTARERIPVEEIVDIAISGAAMRVAEQHLRSLPVRGHVRVSIVAPELRWPAEIEATLIAHEDIQGQKYCRFSFAEVADLVAGKANDFFRLLNRRAAYRGMRASDTETAEVEISLVPNLNAFQRVRMINLSSTGACITVDSSLDGLLKTHSEILVRLQLPDNPKPMMLPSRLRNRHVKNDADSVLYGLQFDWTRAEDPLAQAEEVLSYVLTRYDSRPAIAVIH